VTVSTTLTPIEALVAGLVDYAGLFPPAGLDMATAVRNYATYLADPDRRILGRFIVPVARLEEWESAFPIPARGLTIQPWRLSALVGPDIAADMARVADFNRRHRPGRGTGWATIETTEAVIDSAGAMRVAAGASPEDVALFAEVPIDSDPVALVAEASRVGARAKIRTGGVTPRSIPDSGRIVEFMRACARSAVPFKATAGLHHAVRGPYRLTYEPDSLSAVMHGFINLFLAATFVRIGVPAADAVAILDETDWSAFRFDAEQVTWRTRQAPAVAIHAMRRNFGLSFGSCSFREPVDEMRALQLI
jgi:hypothetical protein